MRQFQILDRRELMRHLLLNDTFDSLLLCEAVIRTNAVFHIDGTWQKEYYDSDEPADFPDSSGTENDRVHPPYTPWRDLRSVVLSLIKGKKKPQYMKLILSLSADQVEAFLREEGQTAFSSSDIASLNITILYRYSEGEEMMQLTSGSSLRIFTPDRSLGQLWDNRVEELLMSKSIALTS